jgi:hypothetical protein
LKTTFHQMQRSKECGLTAVCTAMGLDYIKTSNEFRNRYGDSWENVKAKNLRSATDFLRELGVQGDWFDHSRPKYFKYGELEALLNNEAGVFSIIFLRTGQRHAVAFKKGMIYDSSALYPMSYVEWRRRVSRHIIDGWEVFTNKKTKTEKT